MPEAGPRIRCSATNRIAGAVRSTPPSSNCQPASSSWPRLGHRDLGEDQRDNCVPTVQVWRALDSLFQLRSVSDEVQHPVTYTHNSGPSRADIGIVLFAPGARGRCEEGGYYRDRGLIRHPARFASYTRNVSPSSVTMPQSYRSSRRNPRTRRPRRRQLLSSEMIPPRPGMSGRCARGIALIDRMMEIGL